MSQDYPLDAEGVWCQVLTGNASGGPALFLDRDGVVVDEVGHLRRVEDVVLVAHAAAVIAAANLRPVPVVLVTNQAGIGRGYFDWAAFDAVQSAILAALAASGARLDAVYACAHHPCGVGAFRHADHPARKPNPGMLLRAAADLGLDLGRSWLVGDKAADIEAARRAGLAGALHVLTGHGAPERSAAAAVEATGFEVRFGRSIEAALLLPILDGHSRSFISG